MRTTAEPATATLLAALRYRYGEEDGRITHVERLPAREGVAAPWPEWVPDRLREALAAAGVAAPWRHQAEAASLAWAGRHVVVATGTASGKSLAYQLPALSRLLTDPRATVLYLAPTKALAADQLRSVQALGLPEVRAACYDGDTPREEREWIRAHARLTLTNPDMLHWRVLPGHRGWRSFLKQLAYVVVDECHAYRGVFGSHVAHVLRRLRRLCGDPAFVLASATAGDPAGTASRLTGLEVTAVTDDTSPRGAVTFALWEPPLLDHPPKGGDATPVRRSALVESADLLADALSHEVRTLAFVRSRRGAEVLAATARRALDNVVPGLGRRVAAYRGGYLPEERRALEAALQDGRLLGLATTTALELGVDLVGLDAVILCGYPGRLASLWQQAGRAGRAGRDALCVLVARDDPLDSYLVHHPEVLFGEACEPNRHHCGEACEPNRHRCGEAAEPNRDRCGEAAEPNRDRYGDARGPDGCRRGAPVEATVLDPTNPYVLAPQLCAAAAESALTSADIARFGGPAAAGVVEALVAAGTLRRRPTGWYWTRVERPEVDLRGTGGAPVAVVEGSSGRLLGTVDAGSAHFLLHPGAVYLHQGASYVVDTLDLDDDVALVHPETPEWSTHARDTTELSVVGVRSRQEAGPVTLFLGEVDVTSQVISYQRRLIGSGEVVGTYPLDLPERQLRTVAVWFTISPEALAGAGVAPAGVPGSLHAAEHAAIGLLPLLATCDRWDIGGLSTAAHPDTGEPTVFVYDGHPGGAGFAERSYAAAPRWLGATRDVIAECSCEAGCPSCVQSPKCGNGNQPLDKLGAVAALDVVLRALDS